MKYKLKVLTKDTDYWIIEADNKQDAVDKYLRGEEAVYVDTVRHERVLVVEDINE